MPSINIHRSTISFLQTYQNGYRNALPISLVELTGIGVLLLLMLHIDFATVRFKLD